MGCYSHLSDDEREQIGLAEALGHSIGAIAQAIGRPKSTVWRELCRNRLPSGRYSPLHAAGAYQLRRRRAARIERDRALRRRSARSDWSLHAFTAEFLHRSDSTDLFRASATKGEAERRGPRRRCSEIPPRDQSSRP